MTRADAPPKSARAARPSVYASTRRVQQPEFRLPPDLAFDRRLRMEGLAFLGYLPDAALTTAFLDPQYRGVLDHLAYGNEGVQRGASRAALHQMTDEIPCFVQEIDRVLMPSGHLFLWMDKFHLCTGVHEWLRDTALHVVDMLTWDKQRLGMGYRTRRTGEHLVVLQKPPRRAKGVWKVHNIPDVWREPAKGRGLHAKPVGLQAALIEAVTDPGDVVIDPAAGSFSVLTACRATGRTFLGCDLNG